MASNRKENKLDVLPGEPRCLSDFTGPEFSGYLREGLELSEDDPAARQQ